MKQTDDTMYELVKASWTDSDGTVNMMHMSNVPKSLVLERATQWGYIEPRWYEFWKSKIEIVGAIKPQPKL